MREKEVEAIQKVAEALGELDRAAIQRVLRWAADKFGAPEESPRADEAREASRDSEQEAAAKPGVAGLRSLFAAASPKNDAERALVGGYWLQYHEGVREFDARTLHDQLKGLGRKVSNITWALQQLRDRKPPLVLYTRKFGTSKQARKRYKLTLDGKRAVENMLRRGLPA